MLTKVNTGTWLPAWVLSNNTKGLAALLLLCSMVQSATGVLSVSIVVCSSHGVDQVDMTDRVSMGSTSYRVCHISDIV